MENNKYHKNLTNFLKYFINRPNHLAKYLLENNALDSKFLKELENSKNLDSDESQIGIYFVDINQMNNFFKSLIGDKIKQKNVEDLKTELNKELDNCIKEERYEDAIRIRDYLKKITNNN